MTFLEMDSEIGCLWDEEERILAFFTRRLIEIAAMAEARGSGICPTAVLNAMRIPAVALDRHGFVIDLNVVAEAVFDSNIKIKDRRLFIRDTDARVLLKEAIDQLKKPRLIPVAVKPFIVRRRDKFPVVLRIWSFAEPAHLPLRRTVSPVHAILSVFPVLAAPRQSSYVM
jgi:hypothetical protein